MDITKNPTYFVLRLSTKFIATGMGASFGMVLFGYMNFGSFDPVNIALRSSDVLRLWIVLFCFLIALGLEIIETLIFMLWMK